LQLRSERLARRYTHYSCYCLLIPPADSTQRRPVKRNDEGKAGPHRYAQAWSLTTTDAIGRFLGVNVGTPLQKKLSRLAVLLFFVAVVCAIIVLAANGFSSEQEVIIYAVATGLSMIPASLIVVLTITMAAGTKRMVERNVVVRNLKSLEALGAVTDICSDKTGQQYRTHLTLIANTFEQVLSLKER
jgi:Na+-exporting ATPase